MQPARRWQRRKADRPHEIIDAALEAFAERGFVGARVEDIAQRAGLTKGSVYLYFGSKSDLFTAVVLEAIVPAFEFESLVDYVRHYSGSSVALLREILVHWGSALSQSNVGRFIRLLVSEAHQVDGVVEICKAEIIVPARRLLHSVLQRGFAAGEFARHDVDTISNILPTLLIAVSLWGPHLSIDACIDMLMHGFTNLSDK